MRKETYMLSIRRVFGRLVLALMSAVGAGTLCAQSNKPCVDRAYPKGATPNAQQAAFDAAFDTVNRNGWSFSCGPEIAASEAVKALESFRYGVLYHDQLRLDSVLHYPLPVRISTTLDATETPRLVTIHNFQEWSKLQREDLTKAQTAAIACSWLGGVTVANGRSPGFFIGDGMVWFQSFVGSPKVWVTSVNLTPLTTEVLPRTCGP